MSPARKGAAGSSRLRRRSCATKRRRELHEELLGYDLAVLDFVSTDFLELHPATAFHRDIHREGEGDGIAGDERLGGADLMHLLDHGFEFVPLVDDGAQSLRLLGEVWGFVLFDADRVLAEKLLLRGFELALAAKIGEAGRGFLRCCDNCPCCRGGWPQGHLGCRSSR